MPRIARSTLGRWVGSFRLHPSMQEITLDVILTAVFGVVDDERRAALRGRLLEILATTRSPVAVGLTVERLRSLPRFRRVTRAIEETDQILFAQIADRRADPALADREDILSMLVAARFEDGSAMSDREVRDQLMTLLAAGHETTATALAWAFDLLFRAPEKLERLRAEISADNGREYLDAVIEETLRVRPGRAVHRARAARARGAGRLRAAGRNGRDAGDLPRSHASGRLSRPL